MQLLGIKEIHERLLDMAVVVDGICNKHNVPLYMISGTMLGAIRHKGFIPWDDDMDYAVPYDLFEKLVDVLQKEMPKNLRCLYYNNSESYKLPWVKIEDVATRVIDDSLELPTEKMPGLTIDIFPLVSCDKGECEETIGRIQNLIVKKRRLYSRNKSGMKNLVKRVLRLFSQSSDSILREINVLMNTIKPGDYYVIPVDPNYYSCYFPMAWFFPLKRFAFEEAEFIGPAEYDKYLTIVYKNYMQLPSEEKRRVHCDNVFLR